MNVRKLKGKMAEEGISQRKLAEVTGSNKNSIWRVINGKRDFSLKEAEAICSALNITDSEEKISIFLPDCPTFGSAV